MPEWISSFRDLRVWQQAFVLAKQVHQATMMYPRDEVYSMTDQVRRSSRSVAANIAEAWGKRRYPAAFVSKIVDAQSEAYETQNWLLFAVDLHFHDLTDAECVIDSYDQLIQSLEGMVTHASEWKPK